jgi:hypothetical protein
VSARLLARVVRAAFADRGLGGLDFFVVLPLGAVFPFGLPTWKELMVRPYQPNQQRTR